MDNSSFYKLYAKPSHAIDTTLFGNYSIIKVSKAQSQEPKLNLFIGHELPATNQTYLPINRFESDNIFLYLVGSLIVILILLNLYRKQLGHTILALFSAKQYQQIEQKTIIKHPITFSFFVLFIINFSLVIYYLANTGSYSISNPKTSILFISLVLYLFSFYTAKIILIIISGHIFKATHTARIYIDYIFIWFTNNALFLSLFMWFILYFDNSYLIPIFIGIWGLLYFLRISQTLLRIIPRSSFNLFHFFMYLCAVEILPLIVLGKIVMSGL